jgi:hypothetical protein
MAGAHAGRGEKSSKRIGCEPIRFGWGFAVERKRGASGTHDRPVLARSDVAAPSTDKARLSVLGVTHGRA